MLNLLKADFFRILKTKIVYVSLIIAFVLPLLMSGLVAGVVGLIGYDDPETASAATQLISNQLLIQTTFSSTQNFGIIVPVFTVIVIMADISSGTVRNKLIYGYKRHEIFASHFITSLCYALVVMLVYAGMTLLWSGVILGAFKNDTTSITHYAYFYALGFLGVVTTVAIACALSLSLLNTAGGIILTVVICMFFGFLSPVLAMFEANYEEYVVHILRFLPGYAISYAEIDTIKFIEGLGGVALFSGGFYALGTFVFNCRDFK